MRRAAALLLSLFAGVAVVGADAADADAARRAPLSLARFELHGSNGYRASVEAAGPRLRLTLEKRAKPVSTMVRYSARARTTPGVVRARLGKLGRIAVRFRPTATARQVWPPHECDGVAVVGKVGVFSGTIRFRGEGGYVELGARRAEGRAATSSRWSCGPGAGFLRRTASSSVVAPEDVEAEPPVYAVLGAATGSAGRQFFALASHPDERELPFFAAATDERGQGMRIQRSVAVAGPTRSFVFEDNLGSATVEPPAPFSGSAGFERAAKGRKTWTGDLSVSLPGRPDVPLAGPKFIPALLHQIPGD
jgi:hypothetical protein